MRTVKIIIGIIGVIIIVALAHSFFGNTQCRELRKYGFKYKIEGGSSPGWDIIKFYFFRSSEKTGGGPEIAGDRLKVRCRDVDEDGLDEFIIQSQVWETYQTILKVDIESGNYHVLYTKGLKVGYPKEGYYYR